MPDPYYRDDAVTLYHGDCREVLPDLPVIPDACVTDPPYQETSASWDRWPDGWVAAVSGILPPAASLWCCGTTRMLLRHAPEFGGWRLAQEALWLKHNGSGPTQPSRLVRVHEWAYHWYRGRWGALHHEWPRQRVNTDDKSSQRKAEPAEHRGTYQVSTYQDDGYRQPQSVLWVIEAPSVRGQDRHLTEKPVLVVGALVRECTPLGGTVLDPMAGSGTTGVAARRLGRRAILVEADERLCEGAARRLQAENDQLTLPMI